MRLDWVELWVPELGDTRSKLYLLGKSGFDGGYRTAILRWAPCLISFPTRKCPIHQKGKTDSIFPLLFLFQLKTRLWRFSK